MGVKRVKLKQLCKIMFANEETTTKVAELLFDERYTTDCDFNPNCVQFILQ